MLGSERIGASALTSPRYGAALVGPLGSMTIQNAIEESGETLRLVAQAQADKGVKQYTAAAHAAGCGIALEKAVKAGLEPTRQNFTALFHALYNHSAWRQRFEAKGIFPEGKKRLASSADLLAELTEEGV